jgi:starvation-inducible DNA-binding protein
MNSFAIENQIAQNMKPNIDIKDNHLKELATILNTLLADEYLLYTKTRNAHWNVEGPHFIELHKFFESHYEILDVIIDDVAERVRSLGHYSLGRLGDFLKITHLTEITMKFSDSRNIILTLLADHEAIICNIRKELESVTNKYKDAGTADFITGIMEQHEKMAWMLRAHI